MLKINTSLKCSLLVREHLQKQEKQYMQKILTMGILLTKFRMPSLVITSQRKPNLKSIQNSFFLILKTVNTNKTSPFHIGATSPRLSLPHTLPLNVTPLWAWHCTHGPREQVPALLSNWHPVTGFLTCTLAMVSAIKSYMPREHFPKKTLPSSFNNLIR